MIGIPFWAEYYLFLKNKKKKIFSKKQIILFLNNFIEKYNFKNFNFKIFLNAIFIGLILFLINVLFSTFAYYLPIGDLENISNNLFNDFLINPLLMILYLFILAFAEEFFFRLFLTTYSGIWISSLIFALLHFSYNSFFEIIGAFILGLILAKTWKKTNNFYVVWIAHFLQNLLVIICFFIFK